MDLECNCVTKLLDNGRTQHLFCVMHQNAESLLRMTVKNIEKQTGKKPVDFAEIKTFAATAVADVSPGLETP